MSDFLKRLGAAPLLCDGATGTQLQPHTEGGCYEQLCTTKPDVVRELAVTYSNAGADIVTTNSFGGTRLKLAAYGLAGQVAEFASAAAQLAREGARPGTLVAGSMGPTGRLLAPLGDLTPEEAVECFAQQAHALAAGGADFILIETMMSIEEALAALQGAREGCSLPVACTMAFVMNKRTMFGVSPAQACGELSSAGAVAVGYNCGELTLNAALSLVEEFAEYAEVPIIAQPNAGLPKLIKGVAVYKESPKRMAEYALRFIEAGAAIVGGCCGSTPEHIEAIAEAMHPAEAVDSL